VIGTLSAPASCGRAEGTRPAVSSSAAPLIAAVAVVLASRWWAQPPHLDSLDALLFVRGVRSYSVAALRPHFPGYPVYIAVGKLLQWAGLPAADALRLVSALASALCAPLLMDLSARAAGRRGQSFPLRSAALAATAWTLAPLSWLVGAEVSSDSLGLLAALGMLVLCDRALAAKPGSDHAASLLLAAAGVAGLMLGVRLAYITLLGPLVYSCWRIHSPAAVRRAAAAAVAVVIAWLLVQVLFDGTGLVAAARHRLAEHFGAWPRRVLSGGRGLDRTESLIRSLVSGLGAWWPGLDGTRLPVTAAWMAALGTGVRAWWNRGGEMERLVAVFAVPYAAGVILTADPALPRYALPLVAAAVLLAASGRWLERPPGPAAAGLFVASLAAAGLPLAAAHRQQSPPEAQLAAFVADLDSTTTTLLVTDDLPQVAEFAREYAPRVDVRHVAVAHLPAAAAEAEKSGQVAFAPSPARVAPETWQPIAEFRADPLVYPRGQRAIRLYRHVAPPTAHVQPERSIVQSR
jgi:transmembrane protein TMEM260 (protein O-mannosyltransferase)